MDLRVFVGSLCLVIFRAFGKVTLLCDHETVCPGEIVYCTCTSDDGKIAWNLPHGFEAMLYTLTSDLLCFPQQREINNTLADLSTCLEAKDPILRSILIVHYSDFFLGEHFICSGNMSNFSQDIQIIREIASAPTILETSFEPPIAVITLNGTEGNDRTHSHEYVVNVNDTMSYRATGPVIYVDLSDFVIGQNVSIAVSAMDRCGEISNASYTSIKIPEASQCKNLLWLKILAGAFGGVIFLLLICNIFVGICYCIDSKRSGEKYATVFDENVRLKSEVNINT